MRLGRIGHVPNLRPSLHRTLLAFMRIGDANGNPSRTDAVGSVDESPAAAYFRLRPSFSCDDTQSLFRTAPPSEISPASTTAPQISANLSAFPWP
jgi:hypothetical protein